MCQRRNSIAGQLGMDTIRQGCYRPGQGIMRRWWQTVTGMKWVQELLYIVYSKVLLFHRPLPLTVKPLQGHRLLSDAPKPVCASYIAPYSLIHLMGLSTWFEVLADRWQRLSSTQVRIRIIARGRPILGRTRTSTQSDALQMASQEQCSCPQSENVRLGWSASDSVIWNDSCMLKEHCPLNSVC